MQSVGSKTGLLIYSIAGAILVWVGFYTNTSYLLVAAMLVSPFAGPAMNAALGAAAGKINLLKQSLLRYFMAIGTAILTTFVISLLMQHEHATTLMISVSHISVVTFLLPLAAGVAGAVNLIQSERDSLVSGAAVGMLVAASLAPPTGDRYVFEFWQLATYPERCFSAHFSAGCHTTYRGTCIQDDG
ncbi:hypothetical protein GCM10028895_20700 [Pontibacter rugosus]